MKNKILKKKTVKSNKVQLNKNVGYYKESLFCYLPLKRDTENYREIV